MQWQLVQGRGFSSKLIGWFGGGGYSHIDTVTRAGNLRGARSDIWGSVPAGFFDRPMDYALSDWVKVTVFTLNVTPTQEEKYWEFSDAQIGKQYDSRGILGLATGNRNWYNPEQWFCSEEVCANAEYAGIFPPMYEGAHRVDPGDVAFILCALGAEYEHKKVIP